MGDGNTYPNEYEAAKKYLISHGIFYYEPETKGMLVSNEAFKIFNKLYKGNNQIIISCLLTMLELKCDIMNMKLDFVMNCASVMGANLSLMAEQRGDHEFSKQYEHEMKSIIKIIQKMLNVKF